MPSPLQVVFFGAGAFGIPTLRALATQHQLLAIVTQPDKPAGRGLKLSPSPIAEFAMEHLSSVPLLKYERVSTPEAMADIRALGRDRGVDTSPSARKLAWVIIAFGQKLSTDLLADRFAINLHGSLLPRWRGAGPVQAALLAGDSQTGNTVITLADRMDAGLILGQSARPLDVTITAGDLHDLLSADGPALVLDVLSSYAQGTLQPRTQDESLVTKAKKLSKADGLFDWNTPAIKIRHLVQGLTPWPSVTIRVPLASGSVDCKLLRVIEEHAPTQPNTQAPGTLIDLYGHIACDSSSILRIQTIQPAGGKPMSFEDFARGRRLEAGLVIPSPRTSFTPPS
jgi:methionyl-tRNA formyltransferase